MSACCDHCSVGSDSGAACAVAPGTDRLVVALAGNPNSGKTTIFNALTGLRQKVGNYPGVTVERKVGLARLPSGDWAHIIDLPGTYSLVSRSPDERVAMEVLRGLRSGTPAPDAVIAVVDASNLQRNLYLVSQLIEIGCPLVVALNMMDVAQRRGVGVDPRALARELGVPVVPVVGNRRQGIPELLHAIGHARVATEPDWALPPAMQRETDRLAEAIADCSGIDDMASNGSPGTAAAGPGGQGEQSRAIAHRLLVGDPIEDAGSAGSRLRFASLAATARANLAAAGIDPIHADVEAHYRWIERVVAASGTAPPTGRSLQLVEEPPPAIPAARVHMSERIDAVLIHRVWGLLIFALVMGAVFASMFSLAKPLQDGLNGLIQAAGLAVSGLLPEGPVRSLVRDGIFAGVGSVVVFVPQIAILFLFLALLEDSGYLARAAFLMDRLLARVGLHGKSFIPMLSGFACAIPAIMATRTIEHRKSRLATILVLPFMTCSARLPVYGLLVGTFFAGYGAIRQAGVMLALYALGIAFAAGAALLFRRTMLKGGDGGFILELPTYKVPQLSIVGRQVLTNSSKFLTRAGTTIFAICLILWTLAYYPRMPESHTFYPNANAKAAAQRAYSFAGRIGHAIEPEIRPLGFDWKMGVGCLGAFAAREVFVSTLAIVYGAGADAGKSDLGAALRADRYPDGRPVWTPLVAASLLLWFVIAMQCLSTVMVVRQETGGWKWAVFMLVYMNVLAYVACFALYQVGSRMLGA